jgi:NAD(P)-dependent dehydrogenase (short-subunit alcohol dehydrogenase family)
VTGASRGIGKAIAVALAENGFDVAVAARTLRAEDPTLEHSQTVHKVDTRPLPGSVEETAAEIEAAGRAARPLMMDLTDLATVEAATTKLLDEWGGVDLVVHNGRHIGPGLMDTIQDTRSSSTCCSSWRTAWRRSASPRCCRPRCSSAAGGRS